MDSFFKKRKQNIAIFTFFVALFLIMFVFFRYVHPIVIWDGDDWYTSSNIGSHQNGFPSFALDNTGWLSERPFCHLWGAMAGYISAFLIYPFTEDYIMSFTITAAFNLSMAITITSIIIYKLLKLITQKLALCLVGVIFFLLSSFIIFKIQEGSLYLYWSYNYCSVYYYLLPSCYCSSFALYLITRDIERPIYPINAETSLLLLISYLLTFSYFPAALLLSAISACILLFYFLQKRDLIRLFRDFYFHFVILILGFINIFFNFYHEYGVGYFTPQGNFLQRISNASLFLLKSLFRTNKLFQIISILIIICFSFVFITNRKTNNRNTIKKLLFYLLGMIFMAFTYLSLFGAISDKHLRYGVNVRTDTFYTFYFLIILLLTIFFIYVVDIKKQIIILVPLIIYAMSWVAINFRNSYSDSSYMDSTPQQRYEIMSAFIDELIRKDQQGEFSLTVHMPKYNHFAGYGYIANPYLHNVINHYFSIEWVYEDIEKVYFD